MAEADNPLGSLEIKAVDPRAYLAPKIRRVGQSIGSIFHMLPEVPLAPHGDTLPNALRVEPDIRAEASDY